MVQQDEEIKLLYDVVLRKFVRVFYEDITIIIVDFLCEEGGMEEIDMHEKLNKLDQKTISASLQKLEEHQIVVRKAIGRERENRKMNKNKVYWHFNKNLNKILKDRIQKFSKQFMQHYQNINVKKLKCKKCKEEFTYAQSMMGYGGIFDCSACNRDNMLEYVESNHSQKYAIFSEQILKSLQQLVGSIQGKKFPQSYKGKFLIEKEKLPKRQSKNQKRNRTLGFGGDHSNIDYQSINHDIISQQIQVGGKQKQFRCNYIEQKKKTGIDINQYAKLLLSIDQGKRIFKIADDDSKTLKKFTKIKQKLQKSQKLFDQEYCEFIDDEQDKKKIIESLNQSKQNQQNNDHSVDNLEQFCQILQKRKAHQHKNDQDYDIIYKRLQK